MLSLLSLESKQLTVYVEAPMMNSPFQRFFGASPTGETEGDNSPVRSGEERIVGKIIKLDQTEEKGGWGFISSKEKKFTRIFFHWTSLKQDTLNFQELKNGMKVEFTPVEVEGKGWRAIKIRVLQDEKA